MIIVICSIISGFSKKKPIKEQKKNNRPRTAVNQPSPAPAASAARSSAVQSGEGGGKLSRGGEGSSFSGAGTSQEQAGIKPDKVSSEGVSAYPIRRASEPEDDAELNIAIRELFEHDNLVKGVIIAEVLGKPKALR